MRLSLNRRLNSALDRLLPPGSTERILRDLPPGLKAEYVLWRARCDEVAARYADSPGAYYMAVLEGIACPPMPQSLVHLFPCSPSITTELTLDQVADLYQATLK
jgi:hypothetical protein